MIFGLFFLILLIVFNLFQCNKALNTCIFLYFQTIRELDFRVARINTHLDRIGHNLTAHLCFDLYLILKNIICCHLNLTCIWINSESRGSTDSSKRLDSTIFLSSISNNRVQKFGIRLKLRLEWLQGFNLRQTIENFNLLINLKLLHANDDISFKNTFFNFAYCIYL